MGEDNGKEREENLKQKPKNVRSCGVWTKYRNSRLYSKFSSSISPFKDCWSKIGFLFFDFNEACASAANKS